MAAIDYTQLYALAAGAGFDSVAAFCNAVNNGSYTVNNVQDMLNTYPNMGQSVSANNGWTLYNNTQVLKETVQPNPLNSNVSTVSKYSVSYPLNAELNNDTLVFSNTPKTGSFAQNAAYVMGSMSAAMTAASVGIFLGKTIDSALYNANPDFWDANGMASLNPETWGSITQGDTGLGADLFNFVFGIDPDTEKIQAYIDEDALAYLAMWMNEQGAFAPTTDQVPSYNPQSSDWNLSYGQYFTYPLLFSTDTHINFQITSTASYDYYVENNDATVYSICFQMPNFNNYYTYPIFVSDGPFSIKRIYTAQGQTPVTETPTIRTVTIDGHTYYKTPTTSPGTQIAVSISIPININSASTPAFIAVDDIVKLAFNGDMVSGGGIEGIGTQTGATTPDTSNWDTLADTKSALETQYPNQYANAITYQGFDENGNPIERRKVPVPLPEPDRLPDWQDLEDWWAKPWNATQPQSQADGSSQAQPALDYSRQAQSEYQTATQGIFDTISQSITETEDIPWYNPEEEPNIGDGSTPTPVPSSGSASALWSVYHPTQAQVNSFGAWLWTEDIITQIRQLLENPMQGIITLHKVFASPVDSGSGTIVVGRLDSQVPSATVSQQYVYVDCGSVSVPEYFGNVFDYDPHTDISLYLPFIGIVPLNTADVMRGTVNVTYGVDLFTGACLATVTVSRDGQTAALYQYSGVASVEYPLTGAQHEGLISGLLGIAGGVASFASGNVAGGLLSIAGGAASTGKVRNARASSFSGNAGAMGIKKPYLIIQRPQTKLAATFPALAGYPTNTSIRLGDCSGQVRVRSVHVENIPATEQELGEIESLLLSGVLV